MNFKRVIALILVFILTAALIPFAGLFAAEKEEPEEPSALTEIDFSKIDAIVSKNSKTAEYSVAVVDLKSGEIVGSRNMEDKMSASNMIALPILFTADKRIDAGDITLDRSVKFQYINAGGRGELYKNSNGKYYSLERLLCAMLRSADGNASNSVLDFVTKRAVNTYCQTNEFPGVSIAYFIGKTKENSKQDNFVSAKALCDILFIQYNADTALGRDFLAKNLTVNSETNNIGLGRHLEDKTDTLMDFYNVTTRKYNNISIVEKGDTAYAVAWMSNHERHATLEDIACEVGDYIFETICG